MRPQSTHRVAMTTFWRIFHHDGKISPAWRRWGGGGCTLTPFTISTFIYKVVVYAPAERADTFPLYLLYPYMYSVIAEFTMHAPSLFMKRRGTIKRNQIQIKIRLDGLFKGSVTKWRLYSANTFIAP